MRQTTKYTFFDKFNTESCLNRYDKTLVFRNRTLGRKMGYVWIGVYMIYGLHVIYSDKVLCSMLIYIICLLWYDSDCYFRLLSVLPVKIFKIAMSFNGSLGYMRQIFCRCFLFPGVLWLWHFLYSVGPHPVSSLNIYPLLCRGHSWRVRLAKQETLTPPGHLVSPLVCRGPWISTVVLYCWCHSESASVLLYFTCFNGG